MTEQSTTLIDARTGEPFAPRRPLTTLPEPAQEPLFCPIASVDDHVVEPFTLFDDRIPTRSIESSPQVHVDSDGVSYWVIDGQFHAVTMRDGPHGHPGSEWGWQPFKMEEFRRGIVDPRERLTDMDLAGVWSSLCFPSITWGFAGRAFSEMRDPLAGLACLRAYNDWHIEEWCAAAPDRFIPCQLPWLADPAIAAKEVLANAARGFVSVTFPEDPGGLGYAELESGDWYPFFAACEETDTVINLHCGTTKQFRGHRKRGSAMAQILFGFSGASVAIDWVYSGVFLKFPDLRAVLTESGISFVPKLRSRLALVQARTFESPDWLPGETFQTPSPTEIFDTNLYFASIEDKSAFRAVEDLPIDRIILETDYPHADSVWPCVQSVAEDELGDLAADVIRRICYETATSLYRSAAPPAEMIGRSKVGRRAMTDQ
jgi:predicted TIM-barrel fold metal-dependent hydrolase